MREMTTTNNRDARLALTLGLALCASLPVAFGPADLAAAQGWKKTRTVEKTFFIPDGDVKKQVVSRKLVKTRETDRKTIQGPRKDRVVREFDERRASYTRSYDTVRGPARLERSTQNGVTTVYRVQPVETFLVIRKRIPYLDYKVTEWQESTEVTTEKIYEVTERLTYYFFGQNVNGRYLEYSHSDRKNLKQNPDTDPDLLGKYEGNVVYREPPVVEVTKTPMVARSSRRLVGRSSEGKLERYRLWATSERRVVQRIAQPPAYVPPVVAVATPRPTAPPVATPQPTAPPVATPKPTPRPAPHEPPPNANAKVLGAELISSKVVATGNERRNESRSRVNEDGTPRQTERLETASTLVNPSDSRTAGRHMKTYQVWRQDTIKVVTTTVPYTTYDVTRFEERTSTTLSNTYATTTLYSWRDPDTGEEVARTIRKVGQPVTETRHGDWARKEERKRVGEGARASETGQVVGSRTEERLIDSKVVMAPEYGAALGSSAGHIEAMSTDFGAGRSNVSSLAGRARSLSGATKARAGGGPKAAGERELQEAAARQAVLVDANGAPIWQLADGKDSILFVPFDDKGTAHRDRAVAVPRGLGPAKSKDGSMVHITSISAGEGTRIVLAGVFRNPLLAGKRGNAGTLATR